MPSRTQAIALATALLAAALAIVLRPATGEAQANDGLNTCNISQLLYRIEITNQGNNTVLAGEMAGFVSGTRLTVTAQDTQDLHGQRDGEPRLRLPLVQRHRARVAELPAHGDDLRAVRARRV